jgi:hypothetical protein
MGQRFATLSRAMQIVSAVTAMDNLNLPPVKFSIAQDAKTSVIERIPTAELIGRPQDGKAFVRLDVQRFNHGRHPDTGSEQDNRFGG